MRIERKELTELLGQTPLFAHLNEIDLNRLSALFQIDVVHDGGIVFKFDDPSETMFIVFEGRIELTYTKQDEAFSLAKLQRGDVFGEEALLYDNHRYYSAVAIGETVLIQLSVENYFYIAEELGEIEDWLEVLVHSRQLSVDVPLPWLHEDEFVHVMTRRHPAILWTKLSLPIIFSGVVLLLGALMQFRWYPEQNYGWFILGIGFLASIAWLVWTYVDWRNDYFIVTNKRVVWIEKIVMIYESRQEAPLRTIMSVGLHRSVVGSQVGYADVVVMTYVGTIRLRDLAHAEIVASLIEAYWHRSDTYNRREEAQVMDEKLQEKLDLPWRDDVDTRLVDAQPENGEPATVAPEPGFIAWLFSDFIRLRYEGDGAIIYRKHWFVLIEKIWLPLILLAGALAGLAATLGGAISVAPMTTIIVAIFLLMFVIFVWMIYVYADWRNDIFKVTFDQIIDIDRKPLGKVRRRSAPLENVLSIEYERLGFWGFLFNFGTVYITVGNMRLSFDHVYNPSEVQQDIFYRMGERLEKIRQFEIESERERVSEWIASYHRKTRDLQEKRQNPDD